MKQQFTELTNVNERKEVEEHSNIRNHPQYQYHLLNHGEQEKGWAHIIRYRHKIESVCEGNWESQRKKQTLIKIFLSLLMAISWPTASTLLIHTRARSAAFSTTTSETSRLGRGGRGLQRTQKTCLVYHYEWTTFVAQLQWKHTVHCWSQHITWSHRNLNIN
jgi:hypothetical protein